jgi:hypothetical protein
MWATFVLQTYGTIAASAALTNISVAIDKFCEIWYNLNYCLIDIHAEETQV